MFVQNCDADIWITPPGTEAFQPGKPIPESYILQARVVDGVAWAEPLLYGASTIALPSGGAEAVTLVGTKAPGFHGGPWNVVVGDPGRAQHPRPHVLRAGRPREVRRHQPRQRARARRQARDRQRLHLGPDPVRPLVRVRRVQPRPADHPHAARPDQLRPRRRRPRPRPRGQVAAALQAQLPDTKIHTRDGYRSSIIRYILTRTAIGITFGTSALFGLIIGFVIVALSMFSAVLDNVREFGTLKAIGATNRDLARLLIVQAITYAIIGSILGLSLVTFVAGKIRSPQLAVFLPMELLVGTTIVMIFMCILASSLALLRLRKVEPGMVFR
jgi:putative ABC transport system permease protein